MGRRGVELMRAALLAFAVGKAPGATAFAATGARALAAHRLSQHHCGHSASCGRLQHSQRVPLRSRSGHLRMSTTASQDSGAAAAAVAASGSQQRQKRTRVRAILEAPDETIVGSEVVVKGWVRTKRGQKTFTFLEVNDGSSLKGLQVVAGAELPSYGEVDRVSTGASVAVRGVIQESPGQGQRFELKASEISVLGECPGDYPLQKKRHSLEFLRGMAHLRPRTNTIGAVARVRSALAFATHQFFQGEGFQYLQTPLITASDCEGAGEMFRVTTLPPASPPTDDAGAVDFAKDFFGRPAYLTVSGQLSAETHACALGDVYTFGPTFRAENSQTTRHLAEFNMIEPEMAFADLIDDMDNAEAFVKHVVSHVLQNCRSDLDFFAGFYDKGLFDKLQRLVDQPFARIEYTAAVKLLQEEIAMDPSQWQFPDVSFGTDLQTEHERWLAEKKFNTATFVYNYPRTIKAFYMRDNEDGATVAAMDLLVPGVGELIGGSQREERLGVLEAKLREFGLDPKDYWWYLDLRKYGSVPHAGYGLGFERLVCYVTGIDNIREAIAFPRYPGSAEF